jgi:hypothetical protein
VVAGPVAFVGGGYPDRRSMGNARTKRGETGLKVLVVVRGTVATTVTVGSPGVVLLYDPAHLNATRMSAGERSVTFVPCGGGPQHTQFNGGFVIDHRTCARVTVTVQGQEPVEVELPLGASCS